jgi:MATE family multidrug resistance protein
MPPRNILSAESAEHHSPFSRSFQSSSPIAEAAIARDLAHYADEDSTSSTDEASEASTVRPASRRPSSTYAGTNPHSLTGSYRRPSYFTSVNHATVLPSNGDYQPLTEAELQQAIAEERNLLSDNRVIPAEEPEGLQHKLSRVLSASSSQEGPAKQYGTVRSADGRDTETTALLGPAKDNQMGPEEIDRKWEEAVTAGLINTTWKRETEVIIRYSAPLMVTFLLQYSLTVASIFTIGHLGKEELGAVSLASMTVSITGNAVYSGLATSLDTLCAQAYGSGKKKLVGLQMLRMIYFLLVVTIPIATLWYFSEHVLAKIVPEKRVAEMAGLYLKVALLGLPGYACFESGKRYLQAQGVFSASLYVLIICAPLNAFMNWFFVWVSGRAAT